MQFNENFKSSKHVLQIEDKETGELAGKGTMEVQFIIKYLGERSYPSDVDFKMNVWVKDGRYKYQITDFIAKSNDKQSLNFGLITTSDETDYRSVLMNQKKLNESYLSLKGGVEQQAQLLINSLKTKMAQESNASNW